MMFWLLMFHLWHTILFTRFIKIEIQNYHDIHIFRVIIPFSHMEINYLPNKKQHCVPVSIKGHIVYYINTPSRKIYLEFVQNYRAQKSPTEFPLPSLRSQKKGINCVFLTFLTFPFSKCTALSTDGLICIMNSDQPLKGCLKCLVTFDDYWWFLW